MLCFVILGIICYTYIFSCVCHSLERYLNGDLLYHLLRKINDESVTQINNRLAVKTLKTNISSKELFS